MACPSEKGLDETLSPRHLQHHLCYLVDEYPGTAKLRLPTCAIVICVEQRKECAHGKNIGILVERYVIQVGVSVSEEL